MLSKVLKRTSMTHGAPYCRQTVHSHSFAIRIQNNSDANINKDTTANSSNNHDDKKDKRRI